MIARHFGIFSVVCIMLAGSSAQAGDSNTIWLKQVSPAGTLNGNSLLADQSAAYGSEITGVGSNTLSALAAGNPAHTRL